MSESYSDGKYIYNLINILLLFDTNLLSTEQINQDDLLRDVVEVPDNVWKEEEVHQLRIQNTNILQHAPRNATMTIKIIYNKGWESQAGRRKGTIQKKLAKRRATYVMREAELIFNEKFAVEKRLGTSIKFVIDGGK